jgi:hypothetical protein
MLLIRACAILTVCIPAATAADSALTIYNQNFAVVREHIPITWTAVHQRSAICGRNGSRGTRFCNSSFAWWKSEFPDPRTKLPQ